MAAINDLISQIQDETLRNRIQEEVSKMAKQKKFGLVFEEHMPESTPLYDMPIKRGCNVMHRDSKDDKSIYVVLKIEGDTAVCVKSEQKDEAVTFELKDIVRVAEFGEPIYPYLKPLDSVCNAPDSDLWHTLIEADNYHALQLFQSSANTWKFVLWNKCRYNFRSTSIFIGFPSCCATTSPS